MDPSHRSLLFLSGGGTSKAGIGIGIGIIIRHLYSKSIELS